MVFSRLRRTSLPPVALGALAALLVSGGCGTAAPSAGSPDAGTVAAGADSAPAAPAPPAQMLKATTSSGKIGVELEGLGDGARSQPFVDTAITIRGYNTVDGKTPAAVDEHGWPTTDTTFVLFDIRPFGAWWGPDKVDDPAAFQPDWSGTYHLSFSGQATLGESDVTQVTFANQKYDAKTNLTTADLVVPKGMGIVVLKFTDTKRDAKSAANSGFTDLHILRPGYALGTQQVYTTAFLNSLAPFSTLRYMDWLETNHNPGYFGDAGHHALNWADRHTPSDALQIDTGGKYGVSWEYVIELANASNKDLWINIPVAATDDYVHQLALLLKAKLHENLRIYIEHSNEVWNFGFPQYIYNKLAAVQEVKDGTTKVNSDGSTDQEVWAHRRHAEQLVKISDAFRAVFGDAAMMHRIRPVYASWTINPDSYYGDVLKWVNTAYGPPNHYFYAVADAAYYSNKPTDGESVDQILADFTASSDANVKYRDAISQVAQAYKLKHFQYEVGPDTGGGSTVNVANRILANRDPRMEGILEHDMDVNWFPHGGDLYMYFAEVGAYSRFGCWGLSEDVNDRETAKWKAIYKETGYGTK